MSLADEHDHDDLPQLPDTIAITCPADLGGGMVCGSPMAYAHNVREFHPVRSWSAGEIVLGEATEFDAAEDEDPHLWCTAGHDWAVPDDVELQ